MLTNAKHFNQESYVKRPNVTEGKHLFSSEFLNDTNFNLTESSFDVVSCPAEYLSEST